jgi:SAM-dependent methyltransferase
MAAAPPAGQPDYGLDSPILVRSMFSRGGWTLAAGLAVWFVNRTEYAGPAAALFGVLAAIALVFFGIGGFMIWSSRVGKLRVRDRLLDALKLAGTEKILDAGCGRGLMTIGAAKRLKSGRVTGVDVWNPQDLSGNSIDAAKANARVEGAADRVRFETCDLRKLVFPENNFDVAVSFAAIHHLPESDWQDQAVREMYRVLRPGGRILIFDTFHTGRYAEVLRECGAADIALSPWGVLWCAPSRSVTARK